MSYLGMICATTWVFFYMLGQRQFLELNIGFAWEIFQLEFLHLVQNGQIPQTKVSKEIHRFCPRLCRGYSQSEQRSHSDKKMAKQVWATYKFHIFSLNQQRKDLNLSQFWQLLRLFTFVVNCPEQWVTFPDHHLKTQEKFHSIVEQNQTMEPIVVTVDFFATCSQQ